ncbi:2,4-dihydroxyhept-2-ene-1,7-dioic acid aldolase [Rhodovulum sp. P5]|uniref:HpcH/HpaI aldolase family protein n=1 Tax=Rhodovulum sp. P5 TaxID=1564506 RepID=UPI0009C2C959|nr:HpcH/HpaI aldolase/citrate lyase family protein [Rhodovulum sp. P5]ARE41653.1 2,4-dihydroxyhept-2-ene-1,7-dioic acid aldolase [Rhodovulum sp. P5]
MDIPKNRFKALLKEGRPQIGVWNAIPHSTVADMLAACGFDWIVLDTEHGAMEVTDTLPALHAIDGYPEVSAVVRVAINDWVLIKRHLDQGAQTLMLPYVQSREEAEAAVQAIRYPPRGVRGVAGMTRSSRYGLIGDYMARAEEELCLILQVETGQALDRLEDIATVDGVDGIFIGPADLSASLGYPGQQRHPDVVAAIEGAIGRLKDVGVPSGILTLDEEFAHHCIGLGTSFTAISVDMAALRNAATALLADFK